jgi:hypothetical protein
VVGSGKHYQYRYVRMGQGGSFVRSGSHSEVAALPRYFCSAPKTGHEPGSSMPRHEATQLVAIDQDVKVSPFRAAR